MLVFLNFCPLYRDKHRNNRLFYFIYSGVRLKLILLTLILFLSACQKPSKTEHIHNVEKETTNVAPKPQKKEIPLNADFVKKGETVSEILNNIGLETKVVHKFIQGIAKIYKSSIFPNQSYEYFTNATDSNITNTYSQFNIISKDKKVRYQFVHKNDSMFYQIDTLPIFVDTLVFEFNIESSLYNAIADKGIHPSLLQKIINIYAWDIDFFHDIHKNDHFKIKIEEVRNYQKEFLHYGPVLGAVYTARTYGKRQSWAIPVTTEDGSIEYFDKEGNSLKKAFLKAPLNYSRISSGYNPNRLHPILKTRRPHRAIDYAAPYGTPVMAAGDGVVEYAKWIKGYGKTVKIRHNSVYNSYYAHLKGYAKGVKKGLRVKQSQTIGFVGSTGLSTGPHLDYRFQKNGQYIDPTKLKWNDVTKVPLELMDQYEVARAQIAKEFDLEYVTNLATSKTLADAVNIN